MCRYAGEAGDNGTEFPLDDRGLRIGSAVAGFGIEFAGIYRDSLCR